jgi:HEAT repeat protein
MRLSRSRLGACFAGCLVFVSSLGALEAAADLPHEEDELENASTGAGIRAIRQRFGVDVARRLIRGGDSTSPAEESLDTLRGIERAATVGTPEGVALLVQLVHDPRGLARSDARVLLAATRALAPLAGQEAVARVLIEVAVNASISRAATRGNGDGAPTVRPDPERRARIQLARETAALALASTHDEHVTEALVAAAREPGVGQWAAIAALTAHPPSIVSPPRAWTSGAIALAVALGDPRGEDAILEATRSVDPAVRAVALRAVGGFGDPRGASAATAALEDTDASVREAAARALVDLGAPAAPAAVRKLIEDDTTAARGIELSIRVANADVAGALAARVRVSADVTLRTAAVAALGIQDDPQALLALREFLGDRVVAGDAAEAIARSRMAGVWETIALTLGSRTTQRLGARMAALRGRVHGDVPDKVRRSLRDLAQATDGADRAAGLAALVLLRERRPDAALADADARVRRAVAQACDPLDAADAKALAARFRIEQDPLTRRVLANGLAAQDDPQLSTTYLRDRARADETDAPLAILALARAAGDTDRERVDLALQDVDPLRRAHAARGLATSSQAWAVGRLASAYEDEVDVGVRRTITQALAARRVDASVAARARALDRAARLDPDPAIRSIAERALRGLEPASISTTRDVIWLRTMTRAGAPPGQPNLEGMVVRPDGLAVPVAFDDDGYALVASPSGSARLLLAPRLRAYEPEHHE